MIKVLLVDGTTLSRKGLRALLENSNQAEVIDEAGNISDAIVLIQKLNPEVVLLDLTRPGLNCIEAIRRLYTAGPLCRLLVMSISRADHDIFDCLRAGASGYVPKDATVDELLTAIENVVRTGQYLSPSLTEAAVKDYVRLAQGQLSPTELTNLSARECDVLQLLAEGHTSAAIARQLHISIRTVDTHRYKIMNKLAIRSIAGLTKFAVRHGLSRL